MDRANCVQQTPRGICSSAPLATIARENHNVIPNQAPFEERRVAHPSVQPVEVLGSMGAALEAGEQSLGLGRVRYFAPFLLMKAPRPIASPAIPDRPHP